MKTFKKKILIIGPFNENGGREVEASFIYDLLKDTYDVTIASTEVLSNNNSIYKLTGSEKILSKLRRTGIKFKIINFFFGDKIWFRLNRAFKFSTYDDLISNNDLVFILAQVVSPNIFKIIEISHDKGKKIVFRTTGTNPIFDKVNMCHSHLETLKKVNIYLHHSKDNYERLKKTFDHDYGIIDQTVFLENLINNYQRVDKVVDFYCASRIDKNKNLEIVVKVFDKLKDLNLNLHIYGDGENLEYIKSISNSDKIFFYGHLENHDLLEKISYHHCLIISSFEESGPYTALEAMASSRIILSTKVGAMHERLEDAPYSWEFSPYSEESLVLRILELEKWDIDKLLIIQDYMLNRYNSNYSSNRIRDKYIKIVEKVLLN